MRNIFGPPSRINEYPVNYGERPTSTKQRRLAKKSFLSNRTRLQNLFNQQVDQDVPLEVVLKAESMVTNLEKWFKLFVQHFEEELLVIEEPDETLEEQMINDEAELIEILSSLQAKVAVWKKKSGEVVSSKSENKLLNPTCKLKLQNIELPKFDSDYTQFYNFKQLFMRFVHENQEFNDMQRLYILKQSLVGKAEQILRDVKFDNNAYAEAWSYFLKRFENKRAIVEAHFCNLMNMEAAKDDNSLRQILDKVNAIMRGLKVCGEDIGSTFSKCVAYLVGTKIDATTLKDWKNLLTSNEAYPTFEEMQEFLQNRSLTMEECSKENTEVKQKTEKKSFAVAAKGKCIACSGNHFLNQCPEFKSKRPQERHSIVK